METAGFSPEIHGNRLIARLDTVTNWLMVAIVVVPFLISFGALRDLAESNYISYPLLYPIMIDGGLLIFKALALRASLYGQRDIFAWMMAIVLTIISVALNIVHVPIDIPTLTLARFMSALPPLIILAAFVAVSRRIEENARHDHAITTYQQLTQQITKQHQQLADQIHRQKTELEAQYTAKTAELEAIYQTKQRKIDTLNDSIERLEKRKEGLETAVSKPPKKRPKSSQTVKTDTPHSTIDSLSQTVKQETFHLTVDSLTQRQQIVIDMLNEGHDKEVIADKLGISERTVYREIKKLNGLVGV